MLWNPDTGTWNTSQKLSERRDAHCSWTPDPQGGTYLIGGVHSPSTTEIVHQGEEVSSRLEFDLKYEIRSQICKLKSSNFKFMVLLSTI